MSVSSAHCKGYLSVQMLEVSLFIGAVKHLGKYVIGNAIIDMYNNDVFKLSYVAVVNVFKLTMLVDGASTVKYALKQQFLVIMEQTLLYR